MPPKDTATPTRGRSNFANGKGRIVDPSPEPGTEMTTPGTKVSEDPTPLASVNPRSRLSTKAATPAKPAPASASSDHLTITLSKGSLKALLLLLLGLLLAAAAHHFDLPSLLTLPLCGPVVKEVARNSAGLTGPILAPQLAVTAHAGGPNVRGVVARSTVHPGDTLARAGLDAVMCSSDPVPPVPVQLYVAAYNKGLGRRPLDHLVTSIFLLSEMAQGAQSKFAQYIADLPRNVPSALSWTQQELELLNPGMASEYAFAVSQRAAFDDEAAILEAIVTANPELFPLDHFGRDAFAFAYQTVLARAFYLPNLGVCLLPVFDLFNDGDGAVTYPLVQQAEGEGAGTTQIVLGAVSEYKPGEEIRVSRRSENRVNLIHSGVVRRSNPYDRIQLSLQDDRTHVNELVANILQTTPLQQRPYVADMRAAELKAGALPNDVLQVLRAKFFTAEQAGVPELRTKLGLGQIVTLEQELEILRQLRGLADSQIGSLKESLEALDAKFAGGAVVEGVRPQVVRLVRASLEAKMSTFEALKEGLGRYWGALYSEENLLAKDLL